VEVRYHRVGRNSPELDVLLAKFPDVVRLVSEKDGIRCGLECRMHHGKRRRQFICSVFACAWVHLFSGLNVCALHDRERLQKGRNFSSRHLTRRCGILSPERRNPAVIQSRCVGGKEIQNTRSPQGKFHFTAGCEGDFTQRKPR